MTFKNTALGLLCVDIVILGPLVCLYMFNVLHLYYYLVYDLIVNI